MRLLLLTKSRNDTEQFISKSSDYSLWLNTIFLVLFNFISSLAFLKKIPIGKVGEKGKYSRIVE